MTVLNGKVVLILNGASPLGRFLSLECARKGACVAVWASQGERAQAIVDEVIRGFGTPSRAYQVNFLERERVEKAVEAVRHDFHHIDIVICNVDELYGLPFLSSNPETIHSSVTQNGMVPIWLTRSVLPLMIAQKSGHLVFFGTIADGLGTSQLVDYCASKYMIMGFYTSLRHELSIVGKHASHGEAKLDKNIFLTLICPTLINPHGTQSDHRSSHIPSLWLDPESLGRNIIRAIKKNQRKVVLPKDFLMMSRLVSMFPETAATWIREKLHWSTSMDTYRRHDTTQSLPLHQHDAKPQESLGWDKRQPEYPQRDAEYPRQDVPQSGPPGWDGRQQEQYPQRDAMQQEYPRQDASQPRHPRQDEPQSGSNGRQQDQYPRRDAMQQEQYPYTNVQPKQPPSTNM